ncbi:MAG: hypothetical protein KKF46_00410 [Nanoarchaeota archaeon]|nr:hypothetical protein [Nanoarchaeota archaeon]MBU1320796.1 hypothetical protein [Nanoarchaeota archaeon]MBU1598301.1 hypothetical protein [Nanoarchaeota archaeon]MBU2441800.1 hypothetical protein [Nanoarchaeota archaeon]
MKSKNFLIKNQFIGLFALLVLVAGLLMLSACDTAGLTKEELQAKLIEANTNLETYSFDMLMTMDIMTEESGEQVTIKTQTTSKGTFDRIGKKMSLLGAMKLELNGQEQELDSNTYVIDNTIYTQVANQWIKMSLNADLWDQQDQVAQMLELINSGEIEILSDETIDGKDFYVVRIHPDLGKLVESVLKQQQNRDMFNTNMNFEDIIKDYKSALWINKKSFVIEKIVSEVDMVLTPENIGLETDEVGELQMASITEMNLYGFDEPVIIELPAEAVTAMDLAQLQAAMDQP